MNPLYPVYVISKGRWETRYTARALEDLGVPYHIVVEPQERDAYAAVIAPEKVLTLPFSNLGQGSIPARNWVWEHSIAAGAARHWILDDNIQGFYRLNRNLKTPVADGTIFRAAEGFADRYENVAEFGFHYFMFASRKTKLPPYYLNTRVYSCICLRNDLPYRWRGRYNEDTDLSLRILKDGHATVLFSAFLAFKSTTMSMRGGNTDELYAGTEKGPKEEDGRWKMAESLRLQHPDVTTITRKWGRWQHQVNYSPFRRNALRLRPGLAVPDGVDNHGMVLRIVEPDRKPKAPPRHPFVRDPNLTPAPRDEGADSAERDRLRLAMTSDPAPAPRGVVQVALERPTMPMPDGWRPDEPPSLEGVQEFACDLETTGLRWYGGDRPCGVAAAWRDPETGALRSVYLPTGHQGGMNLDEGVVRRWLRDAVRGRNVKNLHTRFDAHMSREGWDVDWAELAASLGDVGHYAALLDDHRPRGTFGLDSVARDYAKRGKVDLDMSRGAHVYPAWQVTPYGRTDAELVVETMDAMRPLLAEQDLLRVAALEDSVIPVVLEMERNGVLLDVEKLARWRSEVERELEVLTLRLTMATGFPLNPDSSDDMARLFRDRGLKSPAVTKKKGRESYAREAIADVAGRDEVVAQAVRVAGLKDLLSKVLVPYSKAVDSRGVIRFEYHQLRGDQYGTVTGRFSASRPLGGDGGSSPQQIMGVASHRRVHGDDYSPRELFVAPPGRLFAAADAKQIQYRIFAHLSAALCARDRLPSRLAEAYRLDPDTDFHEWTGETVRKLRPDFDRKRLKIVNFRFLFGGGLKSTVEAMGLKLSEGKELVEAYHAAFPEAKQTLRLAASVAENRGYITSIAGRRFRFPNGERSYKALNSAAQGGEADICKRKLRELYDERERLGLTMRITNHDEVAGDVPDQAAADATLEVLNRQTTPLRVPITWSMATGANWAECDKDFAPKKVAA